MCSPCARCRATAPRSARSRRVPTDLAADQLPHVPTEEVRASLDVHTAHPDPTLTPSPKRRAEPEPSR